MTDAKKAAPSGTLGLVLLTTLGLAQRAVQVNFQDWSYNHVWPMFAFFYIAGIVIAKRRYDA